MSSFYGNVGTGGESDSQNTKNHVVISKNQPNSQETGDIWIVLTEYEDSENIVI